MESTPLRSRQARSPSDVIDVCKCPPPAVKHGRVDHENQLAHVSGNCTIFTTHFSGCGVRISAIETRFHALCLRRYKMHSRRFCRSVADDGHPVGYEHLGGVCFSITSKHITGPVPHHDIVIEHRGSGTDDGGGRDSDAYLWVFPARVLISRQERSLGIKSTTCPCIGFQLASATSPRTRVDEYRKQNSAGHHPTELSSALCIYLMEWSEEIFFELST